MGYGADPWLIGWRKSHHLFNLVLCGAGQAFRPYSLQECLETAQHLSEVTEDVKSSV
ncbi:hypothetical protein TELCIR_08156 [Teladorsagia circumcincta]|uniref:Uncharacterized protein n=1 Tax=Teladorsagia circumcincta TaxID=45464 RepID=A0A2G9UIC5_TELCI|nr:hypothetical protein TELCIR_08156 [Teladorsagia circumcincta]